MLKRTRQSLKDLILLFDHHIEKLRKAEALDLDVQISVIEKRLQSEGDRSIPSRQKTDISLGVTLPRLLSLWLGGALNATRLW